MNVATKTISGMKMTLHATQLAQRSTSIGLHCRACCRCCCAETTRAEWSKPG